MPKSVLSNFVNGTRALLVAQIIACTGAIALAGWTLGVTNQVLRERNRASTAASSLVWSFVKD